MAKAKPDAPHFEKDLEQLEAIVSALEEGGLSLDESLKRFEDGIRLARSCEKALTAAEKRIEILTRNAKGELEAKPFGGEDEEAAPGEIPEPPPGEEGEEDEDSLLF